MPNFHKDFPWGRGQWIWNIPNCEGGNIQAIIDKCKKYNISYVIIKSYDGENCFPSNANPQLTKAITDQFHANNIRVYSWSFNYGANPEREANLALWSLEQLGVDGHIFDAETAFEELPDPAGAANHILQKVRSAHPDAFLAHAPYPYIDYHTRFPYLEFGKYCDAVMPQMYWGTIGISVDKMVADMFAQWTKWENSWQASGHGESIKPIIPLGQAYDNTETGFVMSTADLTNFASQIQGYGSYNFWDWEHMVRTELWQALGNAPIKDKGAFGLIPKDATNTTQTTVVPQPHQEATTTPTATDTNVGTTPVASDTDVTSKPAPATLPTQTVETTTTTTTTTPPPAEVIQTIPVPDTGKTTITVQKSDTHPSGVEVKFVTKKRHIDYFLDFLHKIESFFKGGVKK